MANYYTIITNIGKSKIANAQLLDRKVDITEIAVGSAKYNPRDSQETLENEVWRGNIGLIEIDNNNPNWIVLEAVIPSDVGGFTINEVGVFDSSGDMIAVGKYPETYKPILEEGSAKDLYLRMIIEVSNASTVELKIDPTIAIPSQKWVNERLEKAEQNAKNYTDRELEKYEEAVAWDDVENKPSMFPPSAHTHEISDVTDLQDELNKKETPQGAQQKVNVHAEEKNNPHNVTKEQIGLENVANVKQASEDDLTDHTNDDTAHGIGDRSTLETSEKGTIVGALNELFTNVSNGKELIGRAIADVDEDVVVPTEATFGQLATSIGRILDVQRKYKISNVATGNNRWMEFGDVGFRIGLLVIISIKNADYINAVYDGTGEFMGGIGKFKERGVLEMTNNDRGFRYNRHANNDSDAVRLVILVEGE